MKKIPAKYELSQDDIVLAISEWLDREIDDGEDRVYDIQFKTEEREGKPPKGAPVGGMSDYRVTVITAIATEED
jgi:hypothetical protein